MTTSPGYSPGILRKLAEVQAVCTQALNLFRVLTIYLQPVLPVLVTQVETFFRQQTGQVVAMRSKPLLGTTINDYAPLAVRVDPKIMDALFGIAAERRRPRRQRPAAIPTPAMPQHRGSSTPQRSR